MKQKLSMLLIVALALFVVTGSLPVWQGTAARAEEGGDNVIVLEPGDDSQNAGTEEDLEVEGPEGENSAMSVTSSVYAGNRIPLSRAMVTSESGYGDPSKLVDEQALVGSPRDGALVTPYTFWFGDWNMVGNNYPIYAYIDLGQEYDITDIYFYDLELADAWDDENGAVSFAVGRPNSVPGAGDAAWTTIIDHALLETNTWIGENFDTPARTRYIRVGITRLGALVPEIVVYGVPVPAKIPLSPAMVTNETGYGNATLLVNEQELAGDPLNGEGGVPNKFWFGDWNSVGNNYPISAYIDLGREYDLSQIYLYDFNDPGTWDDVNNAHFKVFAGSPSTSWTQLFDHTFANPHTNTWLEFDTNVRTRYIRVEANLLAAIVSEIVLYGAPAEAKLPDKIALNTSMITAEAGGSEAWKLIDEQAAVGNPLAAAGNTATSWWVQTIPARATIDLGQYYDLDNIAIRDGEGAGTVNFYAGSPDNWTKLFSDGLKNFNAWTLHPVTTRTRYVQIEYMNTAKVNEIVLYGTPVATPIPLSTEMVVNESNKGDATLLVDEQSAAGDPLATPTGAPATTWIPSWTEGDYPLSAYIDLGTEYKLTNIGLRDVGSIGNVTLYAGHPASGSDPASWTSLFVDGMKNNNVWNLHPVTAATRYVRVQLAGSTARVGEIVLYGTPLSGSLPDTRAPGQVTNLTAAKPTTTTLRLNWKAPGDDGAAGKADSYEIRYHTSEITTANWADATNVASPPAPLGGGTAQKFVVNGLNADTLYYFALIAKDEAGNVSPLSNVASARTEPLDVTNPTDVTDLNVAFVSGNAVRLTWTAPGDDVAGEGRVTSYDIRYNTGPITEASFDSASAASYTPMPKVADFEQSVWIYGLDPHTPYSFALIARDEANNASGLSNVATVTTSSAATTAKIALNGDMVLNEAVEGNAKLLVDEQSIAGDPKNASGGTPVTAWNVGTSAVYLPASAVIDLGAEYELSDFYLYDGAGSQNVSMFAGDPFDWQPLFNDGLTSEGAWKAHPVRVTTRYLRLLIPAQADIPEIVVYGALKGVPATDPQPVAHPMPKMDEFIGMNAFIDDPRDVLEAVGFIREYHSWNWDEGDIYPFGVVTSDPSRYPGYPNNANRWYNSWAGGGSWNFDDYYGDLKSRGLTVSPVAGGGSVGWLTAAQSNKPIAEDGDPSLPASYIEHADHMYQYAARYGSTVVADNKLKLASSEPRLTGLDFLTYFENWNEPDRWWEGRISHFSPYELSAMTSADYDGHMDTLGDTVGVKNADPNAKLVMSGLAKPDVEYVRAMKFWADYNRGGDLPFDVINIHHYSNNGTNQSNGSVGISPEADRLKERMQEFVEYRDRYMPGVEVWLTEFGYDTHPNSPQKAPAIGATSQEEVQGQWLIRSYLAIAAAGIDKAAMYMVRDVDINSSTKFDTSGLTRGKNQNWSKKPSWYYVYTMKNVLTGYHFDSEVDSNNEDVLIYKFVSDSTNEPIYAVWAPTANNTVVEDYSFDLGASATGATLIELAEGTTEGNRSDLDVDDGATVLDVGERPVFVIAEYNDVGNNGGNGGGNNGNNGNVAQFPSVSNGNITIRSNTDSDGKATIVVPAQSIGQATAASTDALRISIETDKTASAFAIKLPVDAWTTAAGKALALIVDTGTAELSIPAHTLEGILVNASTGTLTIEVAQASTSHLPSTAADTIGDHPAFSFKLTLNGVTIDTFAPLSVGIPYKPKPGEAAHRIVVYYVNPDGKPVIVTNGGYDAATGKVTFTTDHFSVYAVGYRSNDYSDLSGYSWALESIEALSARSIIKGKGLGRFDPRASVTRAEFLTMLASALELRRDPSGAAPSFADVEPGQWYAEPIDIAYSLGIVKGKSGNAFGTDDPIKREDIAVMLDRALASTPGGDTLAGAALTDAGAISGYAKDAVDRLRAAGLFVGFDDGTFRPQAACSRAEAAVLIYRIWNAYR
ncbi:S-layer homology domain-containing protein [Cohnella sp. GCM10027633]|uniref:S-layer homology domain-containing protein n=1 Tax=unclassified Cohnella TaxID=2636738 RepID=UPI0036437E4C